VTRGQLRALGRPAVVASSPGAPAHVEQAADALARLLPAARRERGAGLVAAVRAAGS
jgi:hypothetical protein